MKKKGIKLDDIRRFARLLDGELEKSDIEKISGIVLLNQVLIADFLSATKRDKLNFNPTWDVSKELLKLCINEEVKNLMKLNFDNFVNKKGLFSLDIKTFPENLLNIIENQFFCKKIDGYKKRLDSFSIKKVLFVDIMGLIVTENYIDDNIVTIFWRLKKKFKKSFERIANTLKLLKRMGMVNKDFEEYFNIREAKEEFKENFEKQEADQKLSIEQLLFMKWLFVELKKNKKYIYKYFNYKYIKNIKVEIGSIEDKIMSKDNLSRIFFSFPIAFFKTIKDMKWLKFKTEDWDDIFDCRNVKSLDKAFADAKNGIRNSLKVARKILGQMKTKAGRNEAREYIKKIEETLNKGIYVEEITIGLIKDEKKVKIEVIELDESEIEQKPKKEKINIEVIEGEKTEVFTPLKKKKVKPRSIWKVMKSYFGY